MTVNCLKTSTLLFALAAPAVAQQSYYVDFDTGVGGGAGGGAPSSAFGAAAGFAGTWNSIIGDSPIPATYTLVDTTGAASPVSLSIASTTGAATMINFTFNEASTTGDDELLMDDITYVTGPATFTFSGLPDGEYTVFTYAMAPDSAAFLTNVNVPLSADLPQDVGGSFASGYVLGSTHAQHAVTVTGGADLVIETDVTASFDSINGIQVLWGASSGTVGSNYCTSTINSTGLASMISGNGSDSISSNNLELSANNLPQQPGIFIAGPTQAQIPFFNGFLCINPTGLQRFSAVNLPVNGVVSQDVDIATSAPGGLNVVAGQAYHFQRWNRDPAGGGQSANFSDGLEVMYTP